MDKQLCGQLGFSDLFRGAKARSLASLGRDF